MAARDKLLPFHVSYLQLHCRGQHPSYFPFPLIAFSLLLSLSSVSLSFKCFGSFFHRLSWSQDVFLSYLPSVPKRFLCFFLLRLKVHHNPFFSNFLKPSRSFCSPTPVRSTACDHSVPIGLAMRDTCRRRSLPEHLQRSPPSSAQTFREGHKQPDRKQKKENKRFLSHQSKTF